MRIKAYAVKQQGGIATGDIQTINNDWAAPKFPFSGSTGSCNHNAHNQQCIFCRKLRPNQNVLIPGIAVDFSSYTNIKLATTPQESDFLLRLSLLHWYQNK